MAVRLTLTQEQRSTQAGLELCSVLSGVAQDGKLRDEEVAEIKLWVDRHTDITLPSVDYLRQTIAYILSDGIITSEERLSLQKAIERILPKDIRDTIQTKRIVNEALERDRARELKEKNCALELAERLKNQELASINFMVAGVAYHDRGSYIEKNVCVGSKVYLLRERNNPYDSAAILVIHLNTFNKATAIGYVPRDDAATFASYVNEDNKQNAYVTKILDQGNYPIPVVQAYIYPPESERPEAVSVCRSTPIKHSGRYDGKYEASMLTLAAILIFGLIVWFLLVH